MVLGQLENELNKKVAILNGFCDGCVIGNTCKKNCNRMQTLNNLVNDYKKLLNAYDDACAELSIGSHYFTDMTREEVKDYFL